MRILYLRYKYMYIQPIILYELAFVTAVLALALGVLVISYERTLKRTHKLKKEYEDISLHVHEKAEHLIEDARKKALTIIEQANLEASQMLTKTKKFNTKSDEALKEQIEFLASQQKKILEENSKDLVKGYKESLEELREQNINVFKNISKDIERDAVSEIKDFRQVLEKETLVSQKVVGGKVEEEYKKIQEELVEYKKEKLQEVDKSIFALILSITKVVLGKSLSIEDHEQLVLEALEKAKKENFFN